MVPLALVVHPSIPANTVREFVEYARANPDKLSYGSAGNDNVTHLAAFQFTKNLGIEATHVSYRGSAPADVDLVAGQIQFMTDTINSVMPFVNDKRLKLLAVTTAKRMSLFPNVPTLAETVMTGFEAGAWQGVMVPAKTPPELVQRLNAEIKRRTDVVGIFPNDAAIVRLVGAMLLEQSDEWSLQRRYMQLEGLQSLSDNQPARLSAVIS